MDQLPLFVLLALTLVLFFVFYEAGFRIGRRRRSSATQEAPQVGIILGAALGMLALMLAFTFGMAGSRFDARKQAVLAEANAIGTTWLRAHLLPHPHPEELEPLLMQYVDVRLAAVRGGSLAELEQAMAASAQMHERLWLHAITLGREEPRSVPVGLFVQSLNDVIDMHAERVSVGLRYRIPAAVWFTLYLIACACLTLAGSQAGIGGQRSLPATVLLALTLSAVYVLIVDLDRPDQTLFGVNQDALVDLREQMRNAPAGGPSTL